MLVEEGGMVTCAAGARAGGIPGRTLATTRIA
jgi:hypothetical protein